MMSEVVFVEGYEPPPHDFCKCRDESGNLRRIDLVASGGLGNTCPTELVGKFVKFDYTHPYVEMAEGVSIVDKPKEKDDNVHT